jgi:hypothetical protein
VASSPRRMYSSVLGQTSGYSSRIADAGRVRSPFCPASLDATTERNKESHLHWLAAASSIMAVPYHVLLELKSATNHRAAMTECRINESAGYIWDHCEK